MSLLETQGRRMFSALARLTFRHDIAADLFQELFVRLGESDGFAAADDAASYAWRTAINLAMEWRRRRGRDRTLSLNDGRAISTEPSPLERLLRDEEMTRLLDALPRLSEMTRTCFVLRMIERQPYAEIAERLGKTPHQVRGHCHAAVMQLRELVGETHEREVKHG